MRGDAPRGAERGRFDAPSAWQTFRYLADPTGFLERRVRADGSPFRVRTLMYGEQLFVSRPGDVRTVFAADPDVLRGGEANLILRHVVGPQSVSSLDGEAHAARRGLLLPALQNARGPRREAEWRSRAAQIFDALPRGRPVELGRALRRITLGAMLRAVFGDESEPGVVALGEAFGRLVEKGAMPFAQLGALAPLRRDLGPLSPWAAFARDLGRVDAAIYAQIARRRAELAAPVGAPGRDGKASAGDVLGALLQTRDAAGQTLPDGTLRDELFTLIGAGYETTATAIAWALEAIWLRPELRARVVAELAGGAGQGARPSPLLDASIREGLRLRPVLPSVTRVASRPFEAGGFCLRAGESVVVSSYLAHRDQTLHERPTCFLPERFLGRRPEPEGFFPFGGGGRRCPGMAMALELMRAVLAVALGGFALEPVRHRPARPIFRGSTLAPAGGLPALVGRGSPEASHALVV